MFRKGLSHVGGAIAGFFSGCLSGIAKGCCYNMEYADMDIASPLAAVIGSCWGGVKFAAKGLYEGASGGWSAGVHYSSVVNNYYYANADVNKKLAAQLDSLTGSAAAVLLSDTEIIDFKSYLTRMPGGVSQDALSQQLEAYEAWINKVCPLTQWTTRRHRTPIIVTDDQQNQYVYSQKPLEAFLYHTSFGDNKATINGHQITAISQDYPAEIVAFVKEVKARLNISLAMVTAVGLVSRTTSEVKSEANENTATPLSPRTVAMVQKLKSQGLWTTAPVPFVMSDDISVAINIDEEMNTPLLRRSNS